MNTVFKIAFVMALGAATFLLAKGSGLPDIAAWSACFLVGAFAPIRL